MRVFRPARRSLLLAIAALQMVGLRVRAAPGQPATVDVSGMQPGESRPVRWQHGGVVIRRLGVGDADGSVDDRVSVAPDGSQWIVVSDACTHMGCAVWPVKAAAYGFRCPCHGSLFDALGRVVRGPAREPLRIWPHAFTAPRRVELCGSRSDRGSCCTGSALL